MSASGGSSYQFEPDGSRVYRVRVNVGRDASPHELSVRTTGADRLVVSRQVTAPADSGLAGHRRQITSTFQLPHDVDTDKYDM